MAAYLFTAGKFCEVTTTGAPAAGYKLYTYAAGLLTTLATYTNQGGATPNANPVILDSNGRADVWLSSASYRFILKTAADVTVWDVDNISSTAGALSASTGASQIGYGTTTVSGALSLFALLNIAAGVDPTGVAECSTAIQTEIDRASSAGLILIGTGTYKISAKVVLKGNCDLSRCTFNVYGTPAIALEVSTGSAANPTTILSNATVHTPALINYTKPATGWAGQGIGLRLVNNQTCEIHVGKVQEFAVGLQLTSYGQGCVYNTIFCKQLYNNKIQVELAPGNAAAWTNENTITGGSALFISGEGTNVSGTRTVKTTYFAAGQIINNNRFLGFTFEGDVQEYHVEDQGINQTYAFCRWEATANKVYFNATPIAPSGMEGHVIIGGYAPNGITTTYAGTVAQVSVLVGRKQGELILDQGQQVAAVNGDTTPVMTVFPSTVTEPWEKTSASTDWLVQLSGRLLAGKRTGDGVSSYRAALDFLNGRVYVTGGVYWSSGAGTPEGAITAPIGSTYSRTDGGAATSFYVKESGAGNTGWVGK